MVLGFENIFQNSITQSVKLFRYLRKRKVLLETNGLEDIEWVPDYVKIVMDLKLPFSGYDFRRTPVTGKNFKNLKKEDWIKFVISDREEYLIAKNFCSFLIGNIAFSPCIPLLEPFVLAEWMLEDNLYEIVYNLQIHKFIFPDWKENEER